MNPFQPSPAATPPNFKVLYSQEFEESVLGCMMTWPDELMDHAVSELKKSDFFVPANQEIFDAICVIHDQRKSIDMMVIHQYFVDRKMDEVVGSPGSLASCVGRSAYKHQFRDYTKVVKQKSQLRNLREACEQTLTDINDNPTEVELVLDRAEARVGSISEGLFDVFHEPSAGELVDRVVKRAEDVSAGRVAPGLKIPFPALNRKLQGLHPGDLIIIAARPGVGKTALALNIRNHLCQNNHSVGFFSIEMSNDQLQERTFSGVCRIDLQKIRGGGLSEAELDKIRDAGPSLKSWKMYHYDAPSLTIGRLRSKARAWKRLYNIEVLIVDYLQLMEAEGRNRTEEVGKISAGLKGLAKELGIPIIALAQLNRKASEGGVDSPPQLHQLRESGSIEQDADVVILLHKFEKEPDALTVPCQADIAKQRNGPCGVVKLLYKESFLTFMEEAPEPSPNPPSGPPTPAWEGRWADEE